jgi:cytoskeletal protein CcmA (bactofilin family)
MFASKAKNGRNSSEGVAKDSIKAFLGAGIKFEGHVVFNENMRLDGIVRGEISAKDLLVVGKTADLQAEVSVGTMIISGRFQGNIKARKSVELRFPAQVDAEIEAPAITIEEGVIFNGKIKMTGSVKTVG